MNTALRPFTEHDWFAFAGCGDKRPLINDEMDGLCVVVDGNQLCINHAGGLGHYIDDPHGIPIYAAELPDRLTAQEVAKAILLLHRYAPDRTGAVLQALCGEPVASV